MAYQIKKNAGHVKTGIKTKICFYFMRIASYQRLG